MSNNKIFDNEKRNRSYGLRIGDIVEQRAFGTVIKGEVIAYGDMDNNRVYIKTDEGKEMGVVAEWCTIIIKVEDRLIELSHRIYKFLDTYAGKNPNYENDSDNKYTSPDAHQLLECAVLHRLALRVVL